MSKWNFNIDKQPTSENFESISLNEKIKKIKLKRPNFENPKSITLLESVFDPIERLYQTTVKEGFDIKLDNKITSGMSDVGKDILAGIEGTQDSLQNAFDQVSELTKSDKLKIKPDILKEVNSQSGKVNDALSGAKNFIIPDASVAKLSIPRLESTGTAEKNIFDGGKKGIDSIVSRARGSNFVDMLSVDSINVNGKLDALQGDINNQKLLNPNDSVKPVDDGASPGVPNTSKIEVSGLGDQLKKKMRESVNKIVELLNKIIKFFVKQIKYVGEKIKSFFINFRDNFNYVMIAIANALTHNNASVDEIRVFSSETMKFTMVLFTNIFLYNWYYLMFHSDDVEFRYKINVQEQIFDRSTLVYAIFGPSFRALEIFDWVLLEKIPMIKNYITAKPILFFLLAVIFFFLVLNNFQMSILTSFLKSLTFSTNQTLISTIISIIVFGYGLKFICYDLGYLGAVFNTHSIAIIIIGLIFFILLFIFYILFISSFSAPLGVLLVNTYIVIYSFFAILIYERSRSFTVINDIFTAVSGLSTETEGDEEGESPGIITRIGKFITKYVKYINMFLVELLIIMILLFGINTYTSQYGSISFDKTASINKNSISAPINSAFTRLFTWLIIFNTLLIIFIIVRMVAKYYRLTDPTQQPENQGEGEDKSG